MTNWMTAAGLALIAGGIATLVGFRHALLPGREPVARGERRRGGPPFTVPAQIRARRRRQALAALPAAPSRAAIEAPCEPDRAPGRSAAERSPLAESPAAGRAAGARGAGRRVGGARAAGVRAGEARAEIRAETRAEVLAEMRAEARAESRAETRAERRAREAGLVDRDGPTKAMKARFVPRDGVVDEPTGAVAIPVASAPPKRNPPREGDRIEGWVRPQYQEDEPATGDYWTPVPESYGWPTPVQRLPEAPPYPPRFDPVDVPAATPGEPEPGPEAAFAAAPEFGPQPGLGAEPEAGPQPGLGAEPEFGAELEGGEVGPGVAPRLEQPVAPQWPPAQPGARVELPRGWATRNVQQRPVRRARETPETVEPDSPQRNRPRPRPRPASGGQPDRSTVYRSRHAADPS